MKIRKQVNNIWYIVAVPACVKTVRDFSRYMTVITRGEEKQARTMRYFLNRNQTYNISGDGIWWEFSK